MAELTVRAGLCCEECVEDGDATGCSHMPPQLQVPVLEITLDEWVRWEPDDPNGLMSLPPLGGDIFGDGEDVIEAKVVWRFANGTMWSW